MNVPDNDQTGLPTEPGGEVAPDILAELGPLAYGLVSLGQQGSLSKVRTLQQSRAAQVPAQADRSPDPESRSEALLDELGQLDL